MSIFSNAADALVRLISTPRRHREQRVASWKAVAARHGGTYREGRHTFWKWSSPAIEAPAGEVLVRVDLHRQQVGNAQVVYTRYRARFLLAAGPDFKVVRTNAGSSVATALGFQDVLLGHDAFDEVFVVRTGRPDATRRAWTPRAMELAPSLPRRMSLFSGGGLVTLFDLAVVRSEEALEVGVDLVGELASYGRESLASMRDVRGAEWVPPEGAWDERPPARVRLVIRDHAVFIDPDLVDLRVVVRASARLAREVEAFELTSDENGHVKPEPPRGVLGPTSGPLLARIGVARVQLAGEQVLVTLFGEHSANRLRQAAELCVALALGEPSEGLFR